ncbi:uncharacterized protein KZ484_023676 isoform 3-T4 [Pholidichthys leucotaenia]
MFRNGERTKKKARSEGGVGRLLLKLPRYHPACTAAARKSRSGGTGDEDSEYQPPTSPQPPAPPPAGTKDGGQKNLNSGEMQWDPHKKSTVFSGESRLKTVHSQEVNPTFLG